MHAVATAPAEPWIPGHSTAHRRFSSMVAAFPITPLGRLPHQTFRGLLGVHSRYGLHARGAAIRPFASKASAASLPPRLLRLLPGGMTQPPGRDLHPLDIKHLSSRRTA